MEVTFTFDNKELFRRLCGVADSGIGELEKVLAVQVVPRGNSFLVRSEDEGAVEFADRFLHKLASRFEDNPDYLPELAEASGLFRRLKNELLASADSAGESNGSKDSAGQTTVDPLREKVFTTYRGKPIFPRTPNQARLVQSVLDKAVTLCVGPAGTGKTFLYVASACRLMQSGKIDRIILTRPAVEAGESLGFLPGDLAQKVDPYLRPVYDALYECMGLEKVSDLIQSRKIEIAPLAYMRGRTLNNSAIVLDEAQNCTVAQLKMVLTRLGKNSHMCIGGDATQIDLRPGQSGLLRVQALLRKVPGVGIVELDRTDIIRHPLVEQIVAAFEEVEGETQS